MGHVVFAAPSIGRFYLLHRLRRELLRRGHRVSILCADRCRFTFWREQVSDVDLLAPMRTPSRPDALRDAVESVATPQQRHRAERLLPSMTRWLEREQPELVLFHEERSTVTRCLQFAARSVGSNVLWTGNGLLPHTMQIDERGLDADASCRRWTARDYRVVRSEPELLDASLAHALSGGAPFALPRAEVQVPLLRRRLADALGYAFTGRLQAAATALHGWRAPFASDRLATLPASAIDLPQPFVCVLLQNPDDPRVENDATSPADPRSLVRAALAAGDAIDPDCKVVAVLPGCASRARMGNRALAGDAADRVRIVSPAHAAVAAATAVCTITINHPMATAALLAGTPVVHLGRALYQLDGVTHHCALEALPATAQHAVQDDHPALRRRFLSWILRHGHVWCSPTAANHNGMLGLVQAIERRLQSDANRNTRPLPYRPGPTWPLAVSPPDSR